MKTKILVSAIIAAATIASVGILCRNALSCSRVQTPATILVDGEVLAKTKQRIQSNDPSLKPALDKLLDNAEKAMLEGPFSVADKSKLPPSQNKHDYASYKRYWWPDPSKADGLPYIRRDGETNPDSQNPAISDRPRLDKMVQGTEALSLAYYLTGEERYAEKAAELLRTWFIDPETRMNPNLNYSQGVPGGVDGSQYGVIDGRVLIRAFDGARLISRSPAVSAADMQELRQWCSEYLDWLKTNELARDEAQANNNHGVYFDVQIAYIALFAGDVEYAKQVAESAIEGRILKQIQEDGAMPEELSRTRSFHYSIFTVHAFFQLARLAEHVNVDLWHAADSRIRSALDYLAPYADPALPWPKKDVKEADRLGLLWPLLYAAEKYNDDTYRQRAEKLSSADGADQLGRLIRPRIH